MKPVIRRNPRARIDVSKIAHYFAERNQLVGHRFLEAVEKTFVRLLEMPGMGSPEEVDNPRLVGLRAITVPRFRKYIIYYKTIPQGIEVVRVLYGARDVKTILETEI